MLHWLWMVPHLHSISARNEPRASVHLPTSTKGPVCFLQTLQTDVDSRLGNSQHDNYSITAKGPKTDLYFPNLLKIKIKKTKQNVPQKFLKYTSLKSLSYNKNQKPSAARIRFDQMADAFETGTVFLLLLLSFFLCRTGAQSLLPRWKRALAILGQFFIKGSQRRKNKKPKKQ